VRARSRQAPCLWRCPTHADERDGTDRQQHQTDGSGDSDRRPQQAHEHTGDACEFASSDEPPLQRLDTEVVADRQGLGDAEEFDARGEGEQRRKQDRHDYGCGVHHRAE